MYTRWPEVHWVRTGGCARLAVSILLCNEFNCVKTRFQLPFLPSCDAKCPRMSVDILGTSWDQCVSMDQYCFTSTETRRLVRTDSPGRPPRLSHSSWTINVSTVWPFPLCFLSTVPSGQGLPDHPTEQRDAVQCQQPSGHRHVSCDAQSEPADLSGGQSSRQAPQLHGAAQGAGGHGHRLQSRFRGRPHHHLRYRGPGWTPHQLHHHSGTSIMCRSCSRYQHYVQVLIQVPALCAGLDSGTSIMCRSWFRYQHYVQVLIQVPTLCAGLDPGTSIMWRSWSRYQYYVQVLFQVPALCAGLDSGTSIMCRSWFRYQHYVQVLIQVPALCAGLDSGTSIMCRSWFRYQYYVEVLIQVPVLCGGFDSGTSIMCSSGVPTLVIWTGLTN